jgi:hypothetical protein
LSSCSDLPIYNEDIKVESQKVLIKTLAPQLEKIFNEAAPVSPPERSSYKLIEKLPGSVFSSKNVTRGNLIYDSNGELLLAPGDYVIPVMTFCMKQSGTSPDGHIYSLSKLEGTRALLIRELNLRGSPKFSIEDIQIVSWSLQAGLAYQEMTAISQKIIDEIIPQFKPQLNESFLSVLEKKWDQVANISSSALPSFEDSADELLNDLGVVGQKIIEIRNFKKYLKEVGHDYSRLSELVGTTSSKNKKDIIETQWSQVNQNIYARFITKGHFQEIGFLQIRVLTDKEVSSQNRDVSSLSDNKIKFDLASLVANPNSTTIQPFIFSGLYGASGVLVLPVLAESPLAAALVLAAILTAKDIDWDAYFNLYELVKNSNDSQVKREIVNGSHALQEAHDELEKPLKEVGIINGKTKNSSSNKNGKVRQYDKAGDDVELEKDFSKIPGKIEIAADGKEYKILSNGTKVVKRPREGNKVPTLEMQPADGSLNSNERIRVKVRYL